MGFGLKLKDYLAFFSDLTGYISNLLLVLLNRPDKDDSFRSALFLLLAQHFIGMSRPQLRFFFTRSPSNQAYQSKQNIEIHQ